MKFTKKIPAALCLAAALLTLSLPAFASESAPTAAEASEATCASGESTPTDAGATDTLGNEGAEEPTENPFEVLFEAVSAHAGEIFSALAFIGTLAVAYFYKKGLLPSLRDTLTGLSTALGEIGRKTDESIEPLTEKSLEIFKTVGTIESSLSSLSDTLRHIEGELETKSGESSERKALRTIMLSQVEMLYDIFMATALPQYKKDEIGEKIGAMREELKLCDESTK